MALSQRLRYIVNKVPLHRFSQMSVNSTLYSSTSTTLQYDKDPAEHFTNEEVQQILKSITKRDVDTIFRKRTVPQNDTEYKFMTTEQLEKEFRKIAAKAEEFLQMPPVVKVKSEEHKVISKDPALSNFSKSTYVFTDITYGLKQSERKIVVRLPDGTLEYASPDVRKRVNQIYFPQTGRKIHTPAIFEEQNLQQCLTEGNYEFVLDRVCIQFEPYEQEFHDISSKVYTHINETKSFDSLRSTRHFGPMAFFYAWHKIIDDLLYDMIKRDYLANGVELILLMYKLNKIPHDQSIQQKLAVFPKRDNLEELLKKKLKPKAVGIETEIEAAIGKSNADFEMDDVCLEFIEAFIKTHALKKVQLELAIQTFRESNEEKKKLYEGLRKAHGVA